MMSPERSDDWQALIFFMAWYGAEMEMSIGQGQLPQVIQTPHVHL